MKIAFLHKKCLLALAILAASLHMEAQNGISVSAKVKLSGALEPSGLMRDNLRQKDLLPKTEPYTGLSGFSHAGEGGGEMVNSTAVFEVTGPNAIVDWVLLELRAPFDNTPIATHAALLQRDGDIVGTDGVSPVVFAMVPQGDYRLVVRHRNHLGVMTQNAIAFSSEPAVADFSDPGLPLYTFLGSTPCYNNGTTRSLWLGDANRDKKVIYQGPNNDIFTLFSSVLGHPDNVNGNANFIVQGYNQADFNLDGNTIFIGPNNDRELSFMQSGLNSPGLNFIFLENIP